MIEKRNYTRILFLMLSILICFASYQVGKKELECQVYPIDKPYEFPITPDSPEWDNLAMAGLAQNACRLPEGLVEQMTTKALLETAISYPFSTNILVHEDEVLGFWENAKYNEALGEFVQRPDAVTVLESAIIELPELSKGMEYDMQKRYYLLSVFMDARPWQAVHKERKICRSALEGQMTGCWDNVEYALYCHGCGALSVALREICI